MKVVAAMSGGVDSAVAAARAHEAGHDVTGIHLALSRNPASYRSGARGCCTLEDANDARRAADVIGIPFYVWDLSERFHEDVVEDFMDEYAAGRTPNPCLRCNEKIKFAAVLDRALALGFDAVATGHYAQLRTARRRRRSRCTGRSTTARTSPTCSGCSPRSSSPTRCSRSVTPRSRRSARRPRGAVCWWPRSPTPTTSASSPTATTPAGCARSSASGRPTTAGRSSTPSSGDELGRHDGTYGFTIGQRRGLRLGVPAADGKPRFVLDIEPVSGTVTVGPREALTVDRIVADRPRWCGAAPTSYAGGVQLRAHGAEHRARVVVSTTTGVEIELLDPAQGIAPGQAAVIYDGTRVVGSATIVSTARADVTA